MGRVREISAEIVFREQTDVPQVKRFWGGDTIAKSDDDLEDNRSCDIFEAAIKRGGNAVGAWG